MAKAFNRTTHSKTRKPTNPEQSFAAAIARSNADHVDLVALVGGHIHRQSIDVVHGIPQVVTNANAVVAFMDVRFVPSA
ncbi:hypothetical protein [Roseimaritima ulvae]|uniref:Uncharacterized protein n=1 Tax=Roseimaritima ulvae TaxID=980254 RepID=A0A5B9QJI6_9BACT|nr:hypothetical protein [Roseimaritima ulvae]QEG38129.1 hypothetical protein UC8_00820 [Roseimaritima ulvae]